MSEKRKTRNGQEWLELVQECRASGLSDREWCQKHSISIKTFHNKVSGLRKKAYELPKTHAAPSKQEAAPVALAASPLLCPGHPACDTLRAPATSAAVTARMPGYSVEIADGASQDTISNTLLALGRLCC